MSIEEERKIKIANIDSLLWSLSDNLQELEDEINEYSQIRDTETYVKLDNLIKKLKINNLFTSELENFLEEYLKFYNLCDPCCYLHRVVNGPLRRT